MTRPVVAFAAWALAGFLALLGACAGDVDPPSGTEPTPPTASAPARTPAPAGAPTVVPTATRWTAATVGDLRLSVPIRDVKTPAPLEYGPRYGEALTLLGAVVDRWDADPDNPWAIAHGLTARGPDFTLTNGHNAVDWLFEHHAEEFIVDGHTFVRFPTSRGAVRIEPHTDLILKVLTEIGVDPSRPVTVQGHPHVVGDLFRGSLLETYLVPATNHSSFQNVDDVPWTLQALSTWASPPLQWTAIDGTPMDLDELSTFGTAVLMAETRFMFQAMQAGTGFEKKGQGIFGYTCGGAHMLQGATYAAARGFGTAKARQALFDQVPLMFYRLPRELQIYDIATRQDPSQTVPLLVQRLKFAGHFLESMHKMAALGYYRPTADQVQALEGAAMQVALTAKALEDAKVYEQLARIRGDDEQLYLDVIGDSAHALHGLQLALGQESVRY